MKLLFKSEEFFDGTITCTGRVYLYEVEDEREYIVEVKSPKTCIRKELHDYGYNKACSVFQNAMNKMGVEIDE